VGACSLNNGRQGFIFYIFILFLVLGDRDAVWWPNLKSKHFCKNI
jgi:hypothetical protein